MPGEHSYHNAEVVIGDVKKPLAGPDEYETAPSREDLPKDAPWPKTCACGYVFTTRIRYSKTNVGSYSKDIWQVNDDRYFARSSGPGVTPDADAERWARIRALPPGAMFRAYWLERNYAGPDGMSLAVICPCNESFAMDMPATDGGGRWTRTGTPPKITLSPSINLVGHWHGWLRDGVLVDA